jgi:hypothetical protein
MTCVLGSGSRGCTTVCMTAGSQLCSMGCTYTACVAATETCGNMCDDDGDGIPDDGCAPPAPANDLCTGAFALAGLSGTRSDTFTGATRDGAAGCGGGGEIWYSFSTARETIVYFDTFGTAFDTTISIRSGCGSMPLQCEDDDCSVLQDQLVRVVPPGTYQVAVHSFSAATPSGTVSLRWQMIGATGGDDTRIAGNGTFTGSTAGASVLAPSIPCMNPLAGASAEDGLYFTRCPGASGTVTASSCTGTTYDSVLYVRAAADADLACVDDSCGLQTSVSAGYGGPGLYLIVVDGYNTAVGSYSVAVSGL